ncbi:unnamed protein product [Moneuplotes crassus]|uniref:non-specific serine/threonine protein kinase n=1 Tax=Euplotes crassus TaxID=5936 RepID=A0AAD1X6D4_EUPCR|nr:unnamed protein product [Moneuplotes crassus]
MDDCLYVGNLYSTEEEKTTVLSDAQKEVIWEEKQRTFDIASILPSLSLKKELFVIHREEDITQYYEIIPDVIGQGFFGIVRKGIDRETDEIRAIKTIDKSKIKNKTRLLNELSTLKTLDHPNIVKLFEVYEDDENIHLVMEYCSGGELFEAILNQKQCDEYKTCQIIKQILHAILYCHKNGICHRDIKPDNFMFHSTDEGSNLKLIDFGLATSYYRISDQGEGKYVRLISTVGTCFYMSPEIIKGDYNNSCDIWAVGVILYVMLSGQPPFDGDTEIEILESILKGEYDFKAEIWRYISPEAKDLISNLLTSEDNRLSAKEALKHPWFKKFESEMNENKNIQEDILFKLKEFQNLKHFKKCIYTFMATRAGDEEIHNQMQVFKNLDKNHDGYITCSELKASMKDYLSPKEIHKILESVDTDKNGAINYNEFITATLGKRTIQNRKRIIKAFALLDVNNDGVLCKKDLQLLAKKKSLEFVTPELLEEILQACDYDNDGKVTLDEFERCLRSETCDSR